MAKSKMTICKTCGKEIAKSAKVCPNCGAKNKKKGHPILGILVLIIGIIIIVSAVSGNNSGKQTSTTATQSASSSDVYRVGKTAELNGLSVTLLSVEEDKGIEGMSPSDGNVYLQCEFEIDNNTKDEIAISSALSFSAYCDDYACNISIAGMGDKAGTYQLDGSIAAGKKMKGIVAYEVPSDWKKIEIHFKPDVWSGKELVFADKN